MTLTDFLLARIADDEAAAREAYGVRWQAMDWPGASQVLVDATEIRDDKLRVGHLGHVGTVERASDAAHIARFDPARVLAECETKRRIVELHKNWPVLVEQRPQLEPQSANLNDLTFRLTQQIAWATEEEYRKRFGEEPPTAPMLRLLALPYADHPDYLEEWRPAPSPAADNPVDSALGTAPDGATVRA